MSDKALTLDEIHAETLNILQKMIAICDELEINYFLAYGSLLGAVRHQGFIPWDDDLDVIMLRPDYEKFTAYCTSHEKEMFPYKLMGRYNTPNYPYTINRFCDLRYRMVSQNAPDAGMGMFIDIYPFDGAGNDEKEAYKKIGKKKWFWLNCLFATLRGKFEPSSKGIWRSIAKFPGYLFARLMGSAFFFNRLESLKDSYSLAESKYVSCMVWDWPFEVREKSHFEEFTYLPFEGIQVKVPKEYDAVLRKSYGDYMKLPPVEKRIPHHEYSLYRKPEYFSVKE